MPLAQQIQTNIQPNFLRSSIPDTTLYGETTGWCIIVQNNITFRYPSFVGSGSNFTPEEIKIINHENDDLLLKASQNVESLKEKIENLRNYFGINISQLATIFFVKRPTIYEWLEGKIPNRNNQKRIDIIYSLFKKNCNQERIDFRNYFYNKFDNSKSLYDLLIEKDINNVEIENIISKINVLFLSFKNEKERRSIALNNAGFEEISKTQQKKAISRLLRKA